MSHVHVTIDGHTYRLACGEGEEARITALAAELDTTIKSLKGRLGEIGDRRLAVMAGLMVLDRLSSEEEKAEKLAERAVRAERLRDEAVARATAEAARADMLAARVERLERAREEAALAAGDDDEALLARIAAVTETVERLTQLFHREVRERSAREAAREGEESDEAPSTRRDAVNIVPGARRS